MAMRKCFFSCYRLLAPKPLHSSINTLLKAKTTNPSRFATSTLLKHKNTGEVRLSETRKSGIGTGLSSFPSFSRLPTSIKSGTRGKVPGLVSPFNRDGLRKNPSHRSRKGRLRLKKRVREDRNVPLHSVAFRRKPLPSSVLRDKKKSQVQERFRSSKKVTKIETNQRRHVFVFPPLTLPSRSSLKDGVRSNTEMSTEKKKASSFSSRLLSSSTVKSSPAMKRRGLNLFPLKTSGSSPSSRSPLKPQKESRTQEDKGRGGHSRRGKRVITRVSIRPFHRLKRWKGQRKANNKLSGRSLSKKLVFRRPPSSSTKKIKGNGGNLSETPVASSTHFATRPQHSIPFPPSELRKTTTSSRGHRETSKKLPSSASSSFRSSKFVGRTKQKIHPFSFGLKKKRKVIRSKGASFSIISSLSARLSRKKSHTSSSSSNTNTTVLKSKTSTHKIPPREKKKGNKFSSQSLSNSTTSIPRSRSRSTSMDPASTVSVSASRGISNLPSMNGKEDFSSSTSPPSSISSSSSLTTPLALRLSEQESDRTVDEILAALSESDDVSSENSFSSPPFLPSPSSGSRIGLPGSEEAMLENERPWWLPAARERVLQESALNPVGVQGSSVYSAVNKENFFSPTGKVSSEEGYSSALRSRQKKGEAVPSPLVQGKQMDEGVPLTIQKENIKVVKKKRDEHLHTTISRVNPKAEASKSRLSITATKSISLPSSTTKELSILPRVKTSISAPQTLKSPKRKHLRGKSFEMTMYSSTNHRRFSAIVQDKLRRATEALGSESMFWITRAQALRTSNAVVLPGERPTVIHLDVSTVVPLLSLSKADQEGILDNYPPFFGMGVGILSDRNKWKVVTAHRLLRLLNVNDDDRVLYVDTARADLLGFKYKPNDVIDVRKASAVELYNSIQLDDPYKGEPQRGVALNGITGKRFSQPAHDILLAVGLLRGYISPMWVPERQMKYLNVEVREECKNDGVMTYDMSGLIVPLSSLPKACIRLLLNLLRRKYPDAFKCDLFFLFGVNQWEASRSRALVKHMSALEDLKYPYFFVNVQEFAFQFPAQGLPLYKVAKKLKPYGRHYIKAAAEKQLAEDVEARASGKKKGSSSQTKKKAPSSLEVLPSSLLFVRNEKLWDEQEVRCFFAEDATMRRFYNACTMKKPYLLFPSVRAIGILNGRLLGRRDETILHMHALRRKFSSPLWLTTRMAEKMGVRILYRERKKFAVIGPAAAAEEGGALYSDGFYNIEDFSNNEAILSMFPKSSKNMHFILDGKWRPVMGKFRQDYLASLKYSSTLWISVNECLMSGFEPDPSAARYYFPSAKSTKKAKIKGTSAIVPIYNSQQTTDPVRVIGLSTFYTRPQGTSM